MPCVGWNKAEEVEGGKTDSLPEHDLGSLYRAQHCESHMISKLQKAKREGSKSVAICSIPNYVCLGQTHTPKTGLQGVTSQIGRVWPRWNQMACHRKDLQRKQKIQKGCNMLNWNSECSIVTDFYNSLRCSLFAFSQVLC